MTRGRAAAMALFALLAAGGLFLVVGRVGSSASAGTASPTGKWTCSMCPQFILPDPGKCPKCFMDLIPLEEGAASGGRLELALTPEKAALAGIETTVVEEKEIPLDDVSGSDGVEADEIELALAIPVGAILRNVGRTFVFVESFDDEYLTFTMREIETGRRIGGDVEVLGGLDEGEAVASSGVFRIDSAMQILGKTSLTNLPSGELADDEFAVEPFMPAERSAADPRAAGLDLDAWFAGYESVRAALAVDNDAGAGSAARKLREDLAATRKNSDPELSRLHEKLLADVESLAGEKTLDGRRASFERISGDMVLLARRFGSPAGGLNLIFCPMAFGGSGAHWLQPRETVDNPYHGLEMPLCGWRVDAIP